MAPKITKQKHMGTSKRRVKSLPSIACPSTSSASLSSPSRPLFFYGHSSGPYAFLSQHYSCTFTAPTLSFPALSSSSPSPPPSAPPTSPSEGEHLLTFTTTEQHMMYHKALLFQDPSTAAQIMATPVPSKQKALGRRVQGFDDAIWKVWRGRVVEEANWGKFTTSRDDAGEQQEREGEGGKSLRRRLLETGERELVEASPRDRIWGVGFGKERAEANRERWGLNLLGKALMRVRVRLREEERGVEERGPGAGEEKGDVDSGLSK